MSLAECRVVVITMIAPSPDWFVGLNSTPLLVDGGWLDAIDIELLPYDAGTEEGIGFSLNNPASDPHQPISRVTEGTLAEPVAPMGRIEIRRIN